MTSFDAIVVGSGAGGGTAAAVLAEAGKRVLILERGRHITYDDLGDHRYSGRSAIMVGGGTRVYGAQAWRFLPDDFRMATVYGSPAGSSLVDWPIGYDDLAPYYERVEWQIGVSGDSAAAERFWPRTKGFPMPPMRRSRRTAVLRDGAARLGWGTVAVPMLINSEPRDGRGACRNRQFCVGVACPAEAKNGTHNTMLPRALATGRATLLTEVTVDRIECGPGGQVTGVSYVDSAGRRHEARADVVVCSAGAIATALLLMASATPAEPAGLGNRHDQVGRHLQGHAWARVHAELPEPVFDGVGPGPSVATVDFSHGNDGVIGGGMLSDQFVTSPAAFWGDSVPPDVPRWGAANKRYMRDTFRRGVTVAGPVQEIPSAEARVLPDGTFAGTTHPTTLDTAAFMDIKAREWLGAAGALRMWSRPATLVVHAGQHIAGTCRMGDDPRTSVVDRWGRVHGHDNLFVADASVHVTNGGFNPVLTVMALAWRTAEHIGAGW